MKILVTGSTGFIGTHLLEHLVSKQIPIKAIFHESEPKVSREIIKQVEWIKADITDIVSLQDSLHDVDQIYHCIDSSSPKHTWEETQKICLNGTKNIVNLAIHHNVKKMLYVSKSCTLQSVDEQQLITEQFPYSSQHQWHDKYNMLYQATEKEIWRAMAEGLASIIVNPTHILGVSQHWHNNNNLFKMVYQNSFLGSFPLGYNGFVTIENLIESMLLLMQSNIVNDRFIISAENRGYESIIALIAKGFHMPISQKGMANNKIQKICIRNSIYHFLNKNHTPIDKSKLIDMNKNYQYNNAKFLNYFKHFEYQSIAPTIAKMCDIYKQKFRLK